MVPNYLTLSARSLGPPPGGHPVVVFSGLDFLARRLYCSSLRLLW